MENDNVNEQRTSYGTFMISEYLGFVAREAFEYCMLFDRIQENEYDYLMYKYML